MIFIKGIASIGAATLIGLSAPSARAGYVVDLTQVGSDVVATGSGAIDLTDLSSAGGGGASGFIWPTAGDMFTGPVPGKTTGVYSGVTGRTSFGSANATIATSGSGDIVGIDGFDGELWVPTGYVSDTPLSDTSTYDGATFASLGATPGAYKWTWGSGANQNFTLVVGTAVPEPSTWAMMLIGFAGLGFMGYQSAGRRRTVQRLAIGRRAGRWPERRTP